MKEQFNLSKPEDQNKFDTLPKEEKNRISDEAQEEANLMENKIKKGEAKDYNEAEKMIEMERRAPLYVIYRDNDLFEKQVPEMLRIFSSMERKVDTKVFPREASQEEIEEWYKQNKKSLAGKAIISDNTALIPFKLEEEIISIDARQIGYIDSLLQTAVSKSLLGKDIYTKAKSAFEYVNELSFEKSESLEKSKEVFSGIIRRIFNNPKNIPERVVIFTYKTDDHLIDYDKSLEKDFNDEKKRIKSEGASDKFKTLDELLEQKKSLIANTLIESFENAGLEKEKIEIVENEETLLENPRGIMGKFDKLNNWLIIDRHLTYKLKDYIKDLKNAKLLELPLGNFCETANKQGLLNYSKEELISSLKEIIKERFGRK